MWTSAPLPAPGNGARLGVIADASKSMKDAGPK
jgi:hypothetical protein